MNSVQYKQILQIPLYAERNFIISYFHTNSNHYEMRIVAENIRKNLIYWKTIQTSINQFISKCVCRTLMTSRTIHKNIHLKTQIISSRPLERIQADTCELKGIYTESIILLNLKDHFSKFCWSYIIKNKKAKSIYHCLKDLFENKKQIPSIFHSDNGTEFKGRVIQLLEAYGLKVVHGRPKHPKSQGLIENCNKYIKKYLALNLLINVDSSKTVSSILEDIVRGYNNRKHSVTQFTPNELHTTAGLWKKGKENINNYYAKTTLHNLEKAKLMEFIALSESIHVIKASYLKKSTGAFNNHAYFNHSIARIISVECSVLKIQICWTINPILNVGGIYFVHSEICKEITKASFEAIQKAFISIYSPQV